jgi:predicted negative regulator of RcsB-dependent stress response
MILEHKGDILFKTGDKNAANTFWKNALDLDPTNKKLENKLKEGTL